MMRPLVFLKTPSLLLPLHLSLRTSRYLGLRVLCGYKLASTLSQAPAAAKHGDTGSAGQSMEGRGPIFKSSTGTSRPKPCVTTFDPSRLDSSCFMDISNMLNHGVYRSTFGRKPLLFRLLYMRTKLRLNPFPPGTHGFLYLYTDPLDPLDPYLRFRVTENDNPESFARGTDLVYAPGFPFQVRLSKLLRSPSKEELQQFLIQDGLIDEAHMAELQLRPAGPRLKKRLKWPVTGLNEPFTYDLSVRSDPYPVMICTPGNQRVLYRMHSPLQFRPQQRLVPLFEKGSLQCCFERSTLPAHAGKRVVLMRLLKILEPPVPVDNPPPGADMTVPAEGELFTFRGRLWQRDVDRSSANLAGLRLLFDADDAQMSR